jgi:hypothetical protein
VSADGRDAEERGEGREQEARTSRQTMSHIIAEYRIYETLGSSAVKKTARSIMGNESTWHDMI